MDRSHIPSRGTRFAASESGIATLEFAILLPVLLMMIYGVAEYVQATDHRNKVSSLARTLADLTSQNKKQMQKDEMNLNLASAVPILAPFDASTAQIQISAIGVNANNAVFVCSTWPTTGGTRSVGKDTTLDVPKNFQRAGARYVLAEVKMKYVPLFNTVLNPLYVKAKLFEWSESVSWPVRGGASSVPGVDAEIVMPDGKECNPNAS